MKKTNYFQPKTIIECAIPQMVILAGSHETEATPDNPSTPGTGGGLGAPRKTV